MAKNKNNKNKNTQKSYNKKEMVQETSFTIGVSKVVKCVLAVGIVLGITYLFTIYITDKNLRDSVKVGEARIQYEVILAGESFNQNSDDYVVLYYDENSIADYSEALSEYNEKSDKISLYKCYTNEALNKKFVADDVSKDIKNPEDLRVSKNTLIRFKNHKVEEVITGKDEIISYIKEL